MDISLCLRLAMAHRNMNQADVAKKSGLGKLTISKIARGLSTPTMETVEKIAKSTDYTVNEFFALGGVK